LRLVDFDYRLPPELIAQTPVEPRDTSRLMVLDREAGKICHDYFYNLTQWLKPSDVLVLNRTKVLPARLFGFKEDTGARMEVFLLQPYTKAGVQDLSQLPRISHLGHRASVWEVLLRPAKRLKTGQVLLFSAHVEEGMTRSTGGADGSNNDDSSVRMGGVAVEMRGRLLDILPDGNRVMAFEHEGDFTGILERIGNVPLPPYITAELDNRDRYQTVYARETGSVAAPTAGLHFTSHLLDRIGLMGVEIAEVLLHVGLGTFRPVQCGNVLDHKMHAEYYEISPEAAACLRRAKAEKRRVVAVGTTVARVLESWGCLGGGETGGGEMGVGDGEKGIRDGEKGWTDIFIYPGYSFRWVDALITNFHFPRSTLLMLVSALAGRERVLAAYEEAVAQRYRFYSFGDAMFVV
jgi:S-adenosylmethionine:tRNA ribosyltransferase-isomerase